MNAPDDAIETAPEAAADDDSPTADDEEKPKEDLGPRDKRVSARVQSKGYRLLVGVAKMKRVSVSTYIRKAIGDALDSDLSFFSMAMQIEKIPQETRDRAWRAMAAGRLPRGFLSAATEKRQKRKAAEAAKRAAAKAAKAARRRA